MNYLSLSEKVTRTGGRQFTQKKMSGSPDTENGKGKKSFDWTFVKGFAVGVIISNINKIFVLGALIGTISGIYVEQNYDQIPHVKTEVNNVLKSIQDAYEKSRKKRKNNDE